MNVLSRTVVLLVASACLWAGYALPSLGGEIAARFKAARPSATMPSPTSRPTTSITQIGLERDAGTWRRAPAYCVIIKSDGTFRYTGTLNTPRTGEHTGKVKIGDLVQLLRYIDQSGFEQLAYTSYRGGRSDQPSAYIAVTSAAGEKIVRTEPFGAPANVRAIEQLIDKLLLEAEWNPQAQR